MGCVAVEITRRLGVRYLWIDCLCIIQDDEQDWRREAASMGKVYKNSLLTISATAAEGNSQGCFARRDPSRVELSPTKRLDPNPSKLDPHPSSSPTSWAVIRSNFWMKGVDLAPVSRRGWILQERILSPRIVHFSKEQIF